MDLSSEQRRRQNIADNKRILAEIGLINPFKNSPKLVLKKSGLKRKADDELPRAKKRPLLEENIDHSKRGSVMGKRRRSARIQGETSGEGSQFMQLEDDFDEEEVENKRVEKNRPNHYGAIPGVDVGASWYTRMECCRDGIHRPTVAGIHAGAEGAYSIALSGGYDDNVDYGECFTYTGEGGRDLKGTKTNPKNLRTAPQSKNQTLTRGNLALSRNVETGNPVRVIRGYKLTSPFAPEEGYRYDGLYTVEKAWFTGGTSGFMVWKFALKRCKDQSSPPWEFTEELKVSDAEISKEKSKESDQDKETCELDKNLEEAGNKKEGPKDDEDQDTSEGSPAERLLKANENNENDAVSLDKAEDLENKKNSSEDELEEADEDQNDEKAENNLDECDQQESKEQHAADGEDEKLDAVDEKALQNTSEHEYAGNDDREYEKTELTSQGNEMLEKGIADSEMVDTVNESDQQKSEEQLTADGEDEKLDAVDEKARQNTSEQEYVGNEDGDDGKTEHSLQGNEESEKGIADSEMIGTVNESDQQKSEEQLAANGEDEKLDAVDEKARKNTSEQEYVGNEDGEDKKNEHTLPGNEESEKGISDSEMVDTTNESGQQKSEDQLAADGENEKFENGSKEIEKVEAQNDETPLAEEENKAENETPMEKTCEEKMELGEKESESE